MSACFVPSDNLEGASVGRLQPVVERLLEVPGAQFGAAVVSESTLLDSYLAYRARPWEASQGFPGLATLDEAVLCVLARCAEGEDVGPRARAFVCDASIQQEIYAHGLEVTE